MISELSTFERLCDLRRSGFDWALNQVIRCSEHGGSKDDETNQRCCNSSQGFLDIHCVTSLAAFTLPWFPRHHLTRRGDVFGSIHPPTGWSSPQAPNPTVVAGPTPHHSPAIHQKSEELSPGWPRALHHCAGEGVCIDITRHANPSHPSIDFGICWQHRWRSTRHPRISCGSEQPSPHDKPNECKGVRYDDSN